MLGQFNIYPEKVTETPYTINYPHDHWLMGSEEL